MYVKRVERYESVTENSSLQYLVNSYILDLNFSVLFVSELKVQRTTGLFCVLYSKQSSEVSAESFNVLPQK